MGCNFFFHYFDLLFPNNSVYWELSYFALARQYICILIYNVQYNVLRHNKISCIFNYIILLFFKYIFENSFFSLNNYKS